jgi:PIN domain nuclease of toxin-antitoxin system
LLLDTHILLWALADDPKIKGVAPRLLDQDNEVYFSAGQLHEAKLPIYGIQSRDEITDPKSPCKKSQNTTQRAILFF